ncbi:putative circularly permuted ATP-grasp superfamily protein [Plasticicumulans lactativorans]|uniref:Putative circularly permuted ATP-grasp superfamily protein n=1 Tax=Plasticicumulans lactativorans TaxID=1133106 RepID=A0A4R2LGG4_9GAMM|nr:circularly permuted type 2 ATP-grasp protein [Plasticicumulans lactativorans]TCO82064.1 putative circularly permuted ATP-grasp superfamily protein [Plasticicumulans lactativorans]
MSEAQAKAFPVGELLADYPLPTDGYDELLTPGGELRPAWSELLPALAAMGAEELTQRYDEAQRLLRENGVTFNAHEDSHGSQRAWTVDPIPLPIDGDEWAEIEAGLIQRSRLFERLLADLYGPRTVLRRGILPPELVHAHAGFLHAAWQSLPAGRRWLVFHGVTLARGADGRWLALADHAQAPSGAGYALENRITLARSMPTLYRDAPLRRLASFLETERVTLAKLPARPPDKPNVVLLTPGPGSQAYFEHAYLANYLSLSLVQGGDLVVRDGRVWLKTLGGLKAVDVILRRVTDAWCDPLELRGDSVLGVPGLLAAVRNGGVALANALGVAAVENPGLMPFLPALCRDLLGEELLLPSVASWWCGHALEREYVLANLGGLLVHQLGLEPRLIDGSRLGEEGRAALAARILARPTLYVAQQRIRPATAPVWDHGRLVAQPITLRAFTVAEDDGYRAMPGALAWVSQDGRNTGRGGIAKDVWVLAPAPQPHVSLLRQAHGPVVVTRDGDDLPSRVADNLFWLGRYGERYDARARLLREALTRLLEQGPEAEDNGCLPDLLVALDLELGEVEGGPRGRFLALRRVFLAEFDERDTDGLRDIFDGMLRNGRAVRDHLGDDSWRVLNRLRQSLAELPSPPSTMAGRKALEEHLTLLAAFFGLCNETMPHHYGWRFLDIGRFVERVLNTVALLELAFVKAHRPGVALWEVVLATTDNLTAYRRRYRSALHPAAILDLLLLDEDNPRSVGYQLRRLARQIQRLPKPPGSRYRSAEERLILQAQTTLALANIEALADSARDACEGRASEELAHLLAELHAPLFELSEAVMHGHFSHAETPRQLIEML